MCESVHRKVCTRETQTDTIPGLTMLYINNSPNKQDGCGGKKQMCISWKKWCVLVKYTIIPLSWVW